MIKVTEGDFIRQFKPFDHKSVVQVSLLDMSQKQVDHFDIVATWTSYKKDIKLPKEKRKLKMRTKLQMKNKKNKMITVNVKKQEKMAEALSRLLKKGEVYELTFA